MSFDDFTHYFTSFNVCKTKTCNEIRMKGKFVRLQEENKFCDQVVSKWFYYLEVVKKTHLMLGIH
jgi:hypothetical protein